MAKCPEKREKRRTINNWLFWHRSTSRDKKGTQGVITKKKKPQKIKKTLALITLEITIDKMRLENEINAI